MSDLHSSRTPNHDKPSTPEDVAKTLVSRFVKTRDSSWDPGGHDDSVFY